MKKLLIGTVCLTFLMVIPRPTMAGVDVHVSIPLPPAIVFPAPPVAVVIPETYVYAVPDVQEDIFFYDGWWWRPWEGHWYRSRHHNSGWAYYKGRLSFYSNVPPRWRDDYRNQHWKGHPWNHQRVKSNQLERNWKDWERGRHWERQQTWGVKGLRSKQSEKEVLKAQRKADKQEEKQYKKMQKEDRKAYKDMQKEERKHEK